MEGQEGIEEEGESGVLGYLCGLSAETLETLFGSAATCMSVFRLLPALAQQLVTRLTFVVEPMPLRQLDSWLQPQALSDWRLATHTLSRLQILVSAGMEDGEGLVRLSPSFQKSWQCGVLGEAQLSNLKDGEDLVESKHRQSEAELETYSRKRWECLLQFLALPPESSSTKAVSAEMCAVLQCAGYIREPQESSEDIELTSSGFQFLLLERNLQIWSYLLFYLRYLESKSGQKTAGEALDLLFRISFCSWRRAVRTEGVEHLEDVIQHLREMGLVYMRKRGYGWMYACPMVGSVRGATWGGRAAAEGFLIIETNFRVYAYSASVLQLAILSTFCEMTYRFSNMAVGFLTRDSMRKALQVGITAQQVIDYLASHAHAQMWCHKPLLPPTITDQLRLWELERDRFTFQDAVMYSNFESDADFQLLRQFATDRDVLLWGSGDGRLVIVSSEGHNIVKQFWKQQRKS